jgi:hypothetical protein
MSNGRWYDRYPPLGELLTKLKHSGESNRSRLLKGIKELIEESDPGLVDRYVLEFPMSIKKRRWYDQDPYAWLAINSLKYSTDAVKNKVIDYLSKNLK